MFYRSYIGTLHVGTGLPGQAVDRIHSFYRIPDRSLGKHEGGSLCGRLGRSGYKGGPDGLSIHQGVPLFSFHGFHLDSLPAKVLEDTLHVTSFLFGDGG